MIYFLLLLVSFLLTIATLSVVRKISVKFNVFLGNRGICYLGGVGIFLTVVLGLMLVSLTRSIAIPFNFVWIIVFSFILLCVEWADDFKKFSLKARIIFQIIFIVMFLIYGKKIQIWFLPVWVNYIISCLWIMGITNAFNHLDVKDGLCPGISLIISFTFLMVFVCLKAYLMAYLFIFLTGGLIAVFYLNFPPAKIFMGNSGSHFIGFLFATISIYGDYATLSNVSALFFPILILAIPIFDTTYLIFVRIKKGRHPLKKSDDHICLRYLLKGYTEKRILLNAYLLTTLWCVSAWLLLKGLDIRFLFLFTLALSGTILSIYKANPQESS